MLTKEVSDYKTRLAYYEAIDNKTDSENPQSVDSKFLDNVRKKIQESHADDLTVVKAVEKVRNLYGPFGQEKLKVLESSFECFLENILSGSHLKIAFYACEDFPKNYTEYQKYLKLKKYQQHEKYPDEHVREFINYRQSWLKTKVEFNNWTKNMLPAMKMIREEMKVAIKKLLDARYNIYKTLMRLDLFMEFLPNIPLNRQELMQILEETKHSDFVISSKEALGISEEEIEVIETVKVPKQNIFKNYLVLQNLLSEDEKAPKQFQKMYKFRKLSFVDK